ncbi:MAG: NAD(P)-dependent oxidoreductase [Planctomycetota bacterium]|nr:NAD(P)-dependent oxidoreductase [Planctomycetota bacterium]
MEFTRCRPGVTRIGWIGTGVMGRNMCGHLRRVGYEMTVFNRTREKADSLVAEGAQWADSPKAVAEQSDVVFSIVGYPEDVREVILGDEGVLAGFESSDSSGSRIVVDMTTSEPSLACEISDLATTKNVWAIDAPVSGGDVGAKNGTLSIMIGGETQAVEAVSHCFQTMGQTIVHQGPAGSGQHTKMVNQTLVAAGMVGVCEALLYGYKAGLNLETVLKSVASGAAGSWSLSNLAPRIIDNNFEPGFFVEHFVKDMGIVLREARRMNLSLQGLSLAHQLYQELMDRGHAKDGTHSLQIALAACAGVDWTQR